MNRPLGSWPLLSGPNKDGSIHIGIRVLPDAARQLEERGHIVANKMYERSVDLAAVTGVRIGDVLDVRFDGGKAWWVWSGDLRLGRLTWSMNTFEAREWRDAAPRIDDGSLQVVRLIVGAGGEVVNAGGIVRPISEPVPPIGDAVPEAGEYVPTLRAVIRADGNASVSRENLSGTPRVEQRADSPRLTRKSIWRRLTRR